MRFSVCVSALYPALPVEESIARVRACGAEAYEFWSWQDVDAAKAEAAQITYRVTLSGMCMPSVPRLDLFPDGSFLQGLKDTIALCGRLGCRGVILQAGNDVPGVSRKEQHEGLLRGLKLCAPYAEKANITLLLEPLNTRVDHPGYFLTHAREAFDLVDETESSAVRVLYDIYHQHITEGVDIPFLERNMSRIGHFHLAGHPGRHEPMVQDEIDTPAILSAIEHSGYQGFVGLEYLPLADADESLRQTLEKLHEVLER